MEEHFINIGVRQQWGAGDVPIGIGASDRRSHMHVIGQTGVGKSMLLRNMILQDIEAGHGVGVIDPHGALVNSLLDFIPPRRTDDVVCFFPHDIEFPIGFNVFRSVSPDRRHLVASGIVSIFNNLWSDSWGPRLEHILYHCVALLLASNNVSLLGLQRLLVDFGYRTYLLRQNDDDSVKSFWINEFEDYDDRYRREAIAPIQNKVGQMLNSPVMRNILGQVRKSFDPLSVMNAGGIFLASLSVGAIGPSKANLFGGILVNQFELAAMEREHLPKELHKDFYLYIDEFQNFATDAFESTLSECRKYNLSLILAHQYFDQLRLPVHKAVLGNVGTTVAFRIGESDAELIERRFGGVYPERRFIELGNREIAVKVLTRGEYGEPFLGTTLDAGGHNYGKAENLLRQSRDKYSIPRAVIEEKLKRWQRAIH
jgi:hypothetical protein